MDDLILAGSNAFIKKIRVGISEEINVSKVERDKFRFTGWDIKKFKYPVVVTIKDYAKSMDQITEIRKGDDHHDPLTKLELR